MRLNLFGLFFVLHFSVMYSQVDEIKSAKKALKKNDIETSYSQILEAERKYKESKLGTIDDEDVSDLYYLKFKIESLRKNTEGAIETLKYLKEFEEGVNYSAENKTTDDREYFLTKKELDDVISKGTHESPKEKKRKSYNMKNVLKDLPNITMEVNKKAVDLYNEAKMEEAAKEFENTFLLMTLNPNGKADTSLIQNQAICYQQINENKKALDVYQWLISNNYTGVRNVFEAENVSTGQKEQFPDKTQRDLYVKTKSHKNPTEYYTENLLPNMYKSAIALNMNIENYQEAEKLAKEGQNKFPEDKDMILYMGDIYYKQGKKEEFIKVLEDAVNKDPKNKVLYLNLGIVFAELKQKSVDKRDEISEKILKEKKKAEKDKLKLQEKEEEEKIETYSQKAINNYKKAIEIDNDYGDAYFNLAVFRLGEETVLNNQISKLGYSSKDQKKEEELKEQKKTLFREVLVYLEKSYKLGKSEDINVVKTLKSIYYQLGEKEKEKEMKEKEDILNSK